MLTFEIHYITLYTAGTTCCTAPFIHKYMTVWFYVLLALLGSTPANLIDDCASSTTKALLPARAAFCTAPSETVLVLLWQQTCWIAVCQCISVGSTSRATYWYYQTGAKARPSVKACSLTNNTSLMTGFQFPCQLRTFQKHCNRIIKGKGFSLGCESSSNQRLSAGNPEKKIVKISSYAPTAKQNTTGRLSWKKKAHGGVPCKDCLIPPRHLL